MGPYEQVQIRGLDFPAMKRQRTGADHYELAFRCGQIGQDPFELQHRSNASPGGKLTVVETGSDQARPPYESHGASLLIVTGASHTGKTSVIEAILPFLNSPVALLGLDAILSSSLVRPPGDRWEQIPLAYELIERQTDALLERGWLVIVESTFTYVPPEGKPVFHRDTLKRMIKIAERHGASSIVCRVQAPLQLVSERSLQTRRLPARVVAATARLHEEAELPTSSLTLSTADQGVGEAAKKLRQQLPSRFIRN
jgi:predicted kinase